MKEVIDTVFQIAGMAFLSLLIFGLCNAIYYHPRWMAARHIRRVNKHIRSKQRIK